LARNQAESFDIDSFYQQKIETAKSGGTANGRKQRALCEYRKENREGEKFVYEWENGRIAGLLATLRILWRKSHRRNESLY